MKVKITSCSDRTHWYSTHLGEIFDVKKREPCPDEDSFVYRLSDGEGRGIYNFDCKIILDKNKYPTLSPGYDNES